MADTTMTVEEHMAQLGQMARQASRKEGAVDEVTGNLMIYLEAPDHRTGYIVEVTFLDEEAMRAYHEDEAEAAERAAGWDPTP